MTEAFTEDVIAAEDVTDAITEDATQDTTENATEADADKEPLEEDAGISTGAVVASSVASVAAVGGAAGAATYAFRGKLPCTELLDIDLNLPDKKSRASKSKSSGTVSVTDSNFEIGSVASDYSVR